MSESNNDIPKKKSSAKKTFIGLIMFATICAAITYACIYMTLENRRNSKENSVFIPQTINNITNKKINRNSVKLTDKAMINGITELTEEEHYGEQVDYNEYSNESVMKLEISYVQINGLKNQEIQEKINSTIKNKVNDLKEKRLSDINNKNINRMEISTYVYGNFSDILSISVNDNVRYDYGNDNYEYENSNYGLNFSLSTGDEIKFKDMFWEDSSVKNILSQSIYKGLAWEFAFQNEFDDWDWNMDSINYSEIESKLYNFMYKYNKNPDINFYFDTSTIFIPYGKDYMYSITMEDFYEDIAIYTKYKSKQNLYEGDPQLEEFYVFSRNPVTSKDIYLEEGMKADNIYFMAFCYDNSEDLDQGGKEALKAANREILDKINEYAKNLKADSENGYIIEGMYYGGTEYEGKYGYNITIEISRCEREYFNKHLEDALAAGERYQKAEVGPNDYENVDSEHFKFFERLFEWVEDYTDESTKTTQIYTWQDRQAEMTSDGI